MGIKRLTLQEFVDRIHARYSNFTFSRVSGEFKGQKSRAYLNCPKHGEFECMPIGTKHVVCPGCKIEEVREAGLATLKAKCFELFGDRIKIVDDTYTNSNAKVDIICDTHGRSTIKAGTMLSTLKGVHSTDAKSALMKVLARLGCCRSQSLCSRCRKSTAKTQ